MHPVGLGGTVSAPGPEPEEGPGSAMRAGRADEGPSRHSWGRIDEPRGPGDVDGTGASGVDPGGAWGSFVGIQITPSELRRAGSWLHGCSKTPHWGRC